MKTLNSITRFMLLIAIIMAFNDSFAHDFEVNGIYYNKNGSNAIVTYRGAYYYSYSNEYTGTVNIPSTVTYSGTTYSVTRIDGYAFSGCTSLTEVTIPNSVTSIGIWAFKDCDGLTSVTIPNSVTTIGSAAFDRCTGLTEVTIGNSVTMISDYAFCCCSSLTEVTIPNSVTSIGSDAFYRCTGLTEVTIGNSVTSIGSDAFYRCTGLTEVTIPNSVTSIGISAFRCCSGLTSIVVENGNSKYDSRNNCNAIIETATNTLIYGCKNTIIPNSVTTIGSYAFEDCTGLTEVTIPNSVTTIGELAFSGCTGLTSVIIPNSVTTIGEDAFSGCSGLTSVTWYARSCSDFSSSSSSPFYYIRANIENFTFGEEVKKIPASLCYGMSNLTKVTIPNSVTSIGQWAFTYCTGLTEVTIPNSVTEIGSWAFSYCSGLTDFYCYNLNPATINLGSYVFSNVTTSICTLHVPYGTSDLYRAAAQWNEFTNIVEMAPSSVLATSVILNQTEASLTEGETLQLTATVLPEDATDKTVTWTSSDENIATVDQNGLVTAVAVGTATITATTADGSNLSVSCEISVTTESVMTNTFEFCFHGESLAEGATVTIAAEEDEWGFGEMCCYTNPNSDPENGLILKLLTGNTAQGSATITINENNSNPERILWSMGGNCMIFGSNTSITKEFTTGNGICLVQFDAENIQSEGHLLATLTATIGGETHTVNIKFTNGEPILTLNPSNATLHVGEELLLSASINSNNNNLSPNDLQWTSSDNSVATVDSTGKVTAKGNGTATITASTTDGSNLSASCQVTVITLVESISLDRSQIIMYKDDCYALTATILPETASNKNVSWTSSNSSIVSVDNDGNINAKATGIATVKATTTDGTNLSASCQVQVINHVSSVTFNYTSLVLEEGEIKQITATVYPPNAYNNKLDWSSSNPSVAVVDSTGLVTAINEGNTIISATTTDGSNITATCNVEVKAYTNAVIINKHETSIFAGGMEQLTAQVLPEDAYDKTVTWRTTNSYVASVNSNGLVTANKVGAAKIIATCKGISDTCVVNVMGITRLTLDKHELTLDMESTETLNVTIEPDEAINKELIWSSMNNYVVDVSNTGVVTPTLGLGSTIIIVQTTDGSNVSDTCNVTIIPAYDIYPTTTELMHVRGANSSSVVIPFWMYNKSDISGLQFDITLPAGVSFATVNDYPDVWLDDTRKARNHSVDVNLISDSKYRVLISSPSNQSFKGNEGVVMYLRFNIEQEHPIGTYYIKTSNVIFVEPNEVQHSGYSKSIKIDYKYMLGDADCDATVDIADYTVTALHILNRPTEVFYSDAANVTGDNSINVTDLVGIANISLGIRPQEYRPAPAVTMNNEIQHSMPSLKAQIEGDNIVALSIDNDTPLAGLQLDLQLPQGMTLADATLEGRAAKYHLGTNTLADGRVRLLISSFGDKDIETGNDAVTKLVLEGNNVNNDMLYITGVQAASRDLKSYELNDVTLPVGTTSIEDIGYSYDKLSIYGKGNTIVVNSPSDMLIQVVHVNGMVMPVEIKSGRNTIEVGSHGVYIIRVGNNAYKVRL